MKTLELKELRKLAKKELCHELEKTEKELFKTRFEVQNGQSKNIHFIKKYNRYIAQIKTLQNSQQSQ